MSSVRKYAGRFAPALIVVAAVVVTTVIVLQGRPHAVASGYPSSWQLVFNRCALFPFLSLIVAVVPVARHEIDSDNVFAAGVVATAALILTTVTEIMTVAAHVAVTPGSKPLYLPNVPGFPNPAAWLIWAHNLALLIGALAGLLAWVVWETCCGRLATPNRQNASAYAELYQQTRELRAAYHALRAASLTSVDQTLSHKETLRQNLEFLESELALYSSTRPSKGDGAAFAGRRGRVLRAASAHLLSASALPHP